MTEDRDVTFTMEGFHGNQSDAEWSKIREIIRDAEVPGEFGSSILAAQAALLAAGYTVIDGDGVLQLATFGLV